MGGRPAFVGLLAAIEVVFTFLVERLAADPRAYHLQGALVGARTPVHRRHLGAPLRSRAGRPAASAARRLPRAALRLYPGHQPAAAGMRAVGAS